MKRLLFMGILVLYSMGLKAQELQLHYDFSKERNYLTATFEMFKVDKLGSTFMFSDFDFGRTDGVSLTYFEIARKFTIPNKAIKGLNFHIEYNDGFLISQGKSPAGIPISQAFLTGVGLPIKLGNFTLHTSYLLKKIRGSEGIDGQFTAVWFQNFLKNKVTFRGFLDIWSETKGEGKKAIFITEPQLLYNLNSTFSLGTEIEISKNFISNDWKVFPTIMVRWNL